jgi:hypothetical protein
MPELILHFMTRLLPHAARSVETHPSAVHENGDYRELDLLGLTDDPSRATTNGSPEDELDRQGLISTHAAHAEPEDDLVLLGLVFPYPVD